MVYKRKKNHNTICVGHYYRQANTNNVNKTMSFLQTTGGKDEQNIVFIEKLNTTIHYRC